jgi:predicted nucleic acid-binding protein
MFKILIDTCVWLDLAKDYQQQQILTVLEELIQQGEIELILPRIIVEEFARNKLRIIEDSRRSLSSTLKRAKEVMEKLGDPEQKQLVLSHLNDIDQRIPSLGELAVDTISRIEVLFSKTPVIETSDSVKLLAAQRAIDKRAPFHRQRNGIDDAIIIEIYSDFVKKKNRERNRFAFISHNTKDFFSKHHMSIVPNLSCKFINCLNNFTKLSWFFSPL